MSQVRTREQLLTARDRRIVGLRRHAARPARQPVPLSELLRCGRRRRRCGAGEREVARVGTRGEACAEEVLEHETQLMHHQQQSLAWVTSVRKRSRRIGCVPALGLLMWNSIQLSIIKREQSGVVSTETEVSTHRHTTTHKHVARTAVGV